MQSHTKKIIFGVVIFTAIFVGVYSTKDNISFGSSLSQTGVTAGDVVSGDASALASGFLSTLLAIQGIKLNTDLFSNQSFGLLADNTYELIQPGNEGRPNPFAPIGSDASLAQGGALNVSAVVPSAVTKTSATFTTTITGAPAKVVMTRWFEYGSTPQVASKTALITSGAFSKSVTDLEPGTTYYVRAVVEINKVKYSSPIKSFRTLDLVTGN
jgi:hypothetical protein